ncbi:hypothetical protein [Botrimarina hoheduenensis]|uniref:Uncharacterized protein n=1 Tax=Botrimarina hoheduenensis TaxID=2528000 RepID=A0A5C5W7M9_9BACT|nr:hypothetical protein [Botrimarina hoheduenensis]TWT46447.1 hypothetical protein Pla111_15430 [Botrimarina hoheduenensis]
MSVAYLLPCPCGQSLRINVSQAGGVVTCDCGASVVVPRLRELRNLPEVESIEERPSAWGAAQGVLAIGAILAALLLAAAGWLNANEPPAPPQVDTAGYLKSVSVGVEGLSPAQSYDLWLQRYQPLASLGFVDDLQPQIDLAQQAIALHRTYRNVALIAAGLALAGGIVAGLMLRRSGVVKQVNHA